MPHLFHLHRLLVLLLVLGCSLTAQATHVRGGEISYWPVASTTAGVPRYHVLVTLYCDPTNAAKQDNITVVATRAACSAASASFATVVPKSAVVPPTTGNCQPGNVYQVYTYDTDLDLPAGQWTLSTTLENRMANLLNVNSGNSVNINLHLTAFLDNTLTSQDSSPRFESLVIPILDASSVAPASFSTFDADADSLVYSYVLPQQLNGGATNQLTGCGSTVANALFSPHYQLNPATGALAPTGSAQPQGYYNISGRVSEYRRLNGQWQLLGYVTRDLTYLTLAPGTPANHAPSFASLRVNGTTQPLGQPIVARAGQTLTLGLTATDPDAGQQLRFQSNAPNVVPGLSLSSPAAGQAQIVWQVPATLPPGRYALALDVFDDACPSNFNAAATLTVVVTNQPLAGRPSLNAEHEVYPVPFREQVQFRVAPNQALTLVDALGRTVTILRSGPDGRVLWQPGEAVRPGLYVARTADGQPVARLLRE